MTFPKRFMKKAELEQMGIPKPMLERAYREPGQDFARRTQLKENSSIIFDTEGFAKWWKRQVIT